MPFTDLERFIQGDFNRLNPWLRVFLRACTIRRSTKSNVYFQDLP